MLPILFTQFGRSTAIFICPLMFGLGKSSYYTVPIISSSYLQNLFSILNSFKCYSIYSYIKIAHLHHLIEKIIKKEQSLGSAIAVTGQSDTRLIV